MSAVKAAIPVLASISERRLNKLVDPATSDGLPAFLIGNEDGTESGFMIVQYTAAAIVNDLASRAMPASVYSIPTSANAEDHVSMGANEARHVLAMADDLGKVLALELYTAAQALDLRRDMINAARDLARCVDAKKFAAKVLGAPAPDHPAYSGFIAEVDALREELASADAFHPSAAVAAAHAVLREAIAFLDHDRALDSDVAVAVKLSSMGSSSRRARETQSRCGSRRRVEMNLARTADGGCSRTGLIAFVIGIIAYAFGTASRAGCVAAGRASAGQPHCDDLARYDLWHC